MTGGGTMDDMYFTSRSMYGGGTTTAEMGNEKRVKSNDIGSSIPPEIVEIVVSNLPTKSLFRFHCVSKSWRHIISGASATLFERFKKSNPSNCFIGTGGANPSNPNRPFRRYSLIKLKNERLEHEELMLDLGSILSCSVRCSYNGLLLLIAEYAIGWYCILWNPSIRKWKKISFPDIGPEDYVNGHGICYDQISGSFKIVLLSEELSVYSCKSSTWTSEYNTNASFSCSRSISADGAVYWTSRVGGIETFLLKFDSKDDQLNLFPLPKCFEQREDTFFRLDSLRDTLYLWSIHRKESLMCLWVMKEDHSWISFMDMTYELPCIPWRIWFMNEGNDILVAMTDDMSRLFTCNLSNKVFTRIRSHLRGWLTPYVDCPVFPDI